MRLLLFACLVPLYMADAFAAQVQLVEIENMTLKQPLLARQHHSEPGFWYIAQRRGEIIRWQPGGKQTTFLKLGKRLNSKRHGEAGLLGFAFDPAYPQKPYVYLSYTTGKKRFKSRISRMTCCTPQGELDKKSERIILEINQPYGNHNGGHIAFGPDELLYIGFGDGGAAADPKGHGQNRQTLLGSILRLDVNTLPYKIPSDNPFVGTQFRSEIFAWGLRNPWRFHFDVISGELWAGDVGQNKIEEISIIRSGKNYGWNIMEGSQCFRAKSCQKMNLVMPVAEYSQANGDKSITGGFVYRGKAIPELYGKYIFADFVSGRIFSFDPETKASPKLLIQSRHNISSFAQDEQNEIYVLSFYEGKILKLSAKP